MRHVQSAPTPKLPKMAVDRQEHCGQLHPECWVFHTMPHPPPHIWAHPHDWSLQPLY